jgi:hypothetical protein
LSALRTELILHIGQHKTGSKALQSFLSKNGKVLKARGVLYPTAADSSRGIKAYAISHFRVFVLLRREAMVEQGEGKAADEFWRKYGVYCRPFESLDAIFDSFDAQMARFKSRRLLISAEDLFDLHMTSEIEFNPRWVKTAAQLLARFVDRRNYDPKIVVYLRRQDQLLVSHYAQLINGDGAHTVDFESFKRRFAPRLRSLGLLNFWATAFGPEKILVRPYAPKALPLGTVSDFFENALGFKSPADAEAPDQGPEAVNGTLSRDFIEFIRILNRRTNEKKTALPRRWVLEVARMESGRAMESSGIGEWLSPRQQSVLLKRHAKDNLKIEKIFLAKSGPRLFQEVGLSPERKAGPAHRGLSPQRAMEIAFQVGELMGRDKRRRRALRIIGILVFLGAMAILIHLFRRILLGSGF